MAFVVLPALVGQGLTRLVVGPLRAAALWPSPTRVPDYAASLLAAARPAPSEVPAEGAVMLWRDADEVSQAARVRLSRWDLATAWMDTLGHPCTGRRDLAVVALHLERAGGVNLELSASRQGQPQVTLALTTLEAGEGGCLLVGCSTPGVAGASGSQCSDPDRGGAALSAVGVLVVQPPR